jgi:hypothetical protein
MEKQEIKNLISRYSIKELESGNLSCKVNTSEEAQEIRNAKPEILNYFAEEKEAKALRAKKISEIEGLEELQKAIADEENYHYQIERRFENESLSSFGIAKPATSSKDLAVRYPRAAAYLKADKWSDSENINKRSAGKKALEKIINGEDHEKVLADMEAEWTSACNKNIWD